MQKENVLLLLREQHQTRISFSIQHQKQMHSNNTDRILDQNVAVQWKKQASFKCPLNNLYQFNNSNILPMFIAS